MNDREEKDFVEKNGLGSGYWLLRNKGYSQQSAIYHCMGNENSVYYSKENYLKRLGLWDFENNKEKTVKPIQPDFGGGKT